MRLGAPLVTLRTKLVGASAHFIETLAQKPYLDRQGGHCGRLRRLSGRNAFRLRAYRPRRLAAALRPT